MCELPAPARRTWPEPPEPEPEPDRRPGCVRKFGNPDLARGRTGRHGRRLRPSAPPQRRSGALGVTGTMVLRAVVSLVAALQFASGQQHAVIVLEETVTIHNHLQSFSSHITQPHDFEFEAVSGTRYELELRTGQPEGAMSPCTYNVNDFIGHWNTCDSLIASGHHSCAVDFCADCGASAHSCDFSCGYLCSLVPCTSNYHDDNPEFLGWVGSERVFSPTCDSEISSGQRSCAADYCSNCTQAHECDLSCGILCNLAGIMRTDVRLLVPLGATTTTTQCSATGTGRGSQDAGPYTVEDSTQCIAVQNYGGPVDKSIGFTAGASGTFTVHVRVSALDGSGPVTLTVTAIALGLSRGRQQQLPLIVLDETVSLIQVMQHHDFEFEAVAGMRYHLRMRAGEGSGELSSCVGDAYGENGITEDRCDPLWLFGGCRYGFGSCRYGSCATDFCSECEYAHVCDLYCGFTCAEDGVTRTSLYLLAPGGQFEKVGDRNSNIDLSQAVVTDFNTTASADLEFNATVNGTYTMRVYAYEGSGPVTVAVSREGQPQLSDIDCRTLAVNTLAHPGCAGVVDSVAASTGAPSEDQPCTLGCAEQWVGIGAQCAELSASLEAEAPGVTDACAATAAAVLATAPGHISLSGLTCHPLANAQYALQLAPLNSRPHYATITGADPAAGWHLYWSPGYFTVARHGWSERIPRAKTRPQSLSRLRSLRPLAPAFGSRDAIHHV